MMNTRNPFIAGNWKMNLPPSKAVQFIEDFLRLLPLRHSFDVALFPNFVSLSAVKSALSHRHDIFLGAQNLSEYTSGAFTGETSAEMILETGCTHVLTGHSERRHIFAESDDQLRKKLLQSISTGLVPVYCIGERLSEREKRETFSVLERQLLVLVDFEDVDVEKVIIAYEPVWAIGTGLTATPEQAQEAHDFIRRFLRLTRGVLAEKTRILYGGSVTPSNARELLACEDVDGMLVGGASLQPSSFYSICEAAME